MPPTSTASRAASGSTWPRAISSSPIGVARFATCYPAGTTSTGRVTPCEINRRPLSSSHVAGSALGYPLLRRRFPDRLERGAGEAGGELLVGDRVWVALDHEPGAVGAGGERDAELQ